VNGARGGGPQDAAATAQFPRPDFNAQPDYNAQQGYGAQQNYGAQADYRAPSDYNAQQNFTAPRPQVPSPAPGAQAGYSPVQHQGGGDTGGYAAPRQPASLPQQPEALPPAGPGDGRTPLFDTLETNWFHGTQQAAAAAAQQQQSAPAPAAPQQQTSPSLPPVPHREPANGSGSNGSGSNSAGSNGTGTNGSGTNGSHANGVGVTSSWRTSPNDELVRQAERVRKPAAGGITTSGLPRRVPRANLVPGTAQEQNNQAGPQVSRAPADVRGRLTNLRRGIQQGRQAGSAGPANSSFNLGPSHQQER
jgi:hypothetical protein